MLSLLRAGGPVIDPVISGENGQEGTKVLGSLSVVTVEGLLLIGRTPARPPVGGGWWVWPPELDKG